MRVVVTGAAGFIGSHVAELLVDEGHDVVGIDSLDPAAHGDNRPELHPGVRWRIADVRDRGLWMETLPDADAVCHQAAKVGLGVDFADAPGYVSNNDLGTATMLACMFEAGFEGRLVVASSMVVYGEGLYRCRTHGTTRPGPRSVDAMEEGEFEPPCPDCGAGLEPLSINEEAPTDPRNVYAATKLHQEHLCAAWARECSTTATMLRYHNVYGPRMPRDTPYAGVMSIFASSLAAGRRPQVFEDGAQRRDFVHVRDVARANVAALSAAHGHQGALNIASGHPCTLLEAAAILSEAHAERTGVELPPEVVGGYRLGDVRHITAQPARSAETIGFTAEIEPATGLAAFAGDELRRPPAT